MDGYVQRHMSVSTGPPAASGGQLRLYAQRGLVEALFVHHGGLVQQVLGHLRGGDERGSSRGGTTAPAPPGARHPRAGRQGRPAGTGGDASHSVWPLLLFSIDLVFLFLVILNHTRSRLLLTVSWAEHQMKCFGLVLKKNKP